MIVTKITQQKKNTNRYNIFIDDEFAFGMDGVDVYRHHLKEGCQISIEELEEIYSTTLFANGREMALKYLTFKARTEKEIRDKLSDDYREDIIEKVLEFLRRYNYVNDEEYTEKYILDRVNLKRYGMRRVVEELKTKGISTILINETYTRLSDNCDIDEFDSAITVLAKKFRGKDESDRKEREKIFAALARRGFSYDIVKEAYVAYCDGLDEEK